MEFTEQEYTDMATSTRRPIAGQSLVESPDSPSAYTQPPKFTDKESAINYFLELFTEPERYESIMELLEEGMPVMDLVELFLKESFQKGEINPDLMLLLAEPLAYLILGLSEREGIRATIVDDPEDPENYDDDDYDPEDENDEDIEFLQNPFRSKIQQIKTPQDDEELSIDKKLENVPSLMERRTG
jgi:hypothetical protein